MTGRAPAASFVLALALAIATAAAAGGCTGRETRHSRDASVDRLEASLGRAIDVDAIAARARPALVLVESAAGRAAGAIVGGSGLVATSRRGASGPAQVELFDGAREPATLRTFVEDADLALLRLRGRLTGYAPLAIARDVRLEEPVLILRPEGGGDIEAAGGRVALVDMCFALAPGDRFFDPGLWIRGAPASAAEDLGAPVVNLKGEVVGVVAGVFDGGVLASSLVTLGPRLAVAPVRGPAAPPVAPEARPARFVEALRRNAELRIEHRARELGATERAPYVARARAASDALVARLRERWRRAPTLTAAMASSALAEMERAVGGPPSP